MPTLYVRLHGLRNLSDEVVEVNKSRVYCKISLNSFHDTTPVVKASRSDSDLIVVPFPNLEFKGLGVASRATLSFDDLLIIRVKVKSTFRDKPVGIAAISIKEVSNQGNPDAQAWFPLTTYKRGPRAKGDICISTFWTSEDLDEPLDSGNNESMNAFANSSMSQRSSMSMSTRSFSFESPFRKHKHRSKKTQEMLSQYAGFSSGYTLNSPSVELVGEWDFSKAKMEDDHEYQQDEESPDEGEGRNSNLKTLSPTARARTAFKQNAKKKLLQIVGGGSQSPNPTKDVANKIINLQTATGPVLQIVILEGRGLLALDKNGLSDPYCVVKMKGVRVKTSIKSKTLTPIWNETMFIGDHVLLEQDDHVRITLKDHDYASRDDYMGMLQIPLRSLFKEPDAFITGASVKPQWYTLQQCNGMRHQVRGELKLEFVLHIPSKRVISPPEVIRARPPVTNLHYSCKPRPIVRVTVLQARNIIVSDTNGSSDPFVKLRLRDVEFITPVVKKNLNPMWNLEYVFGDDNGVYINELDTLKVAVFDQDILSADDQIGQIHVPLWSVIGDTKPRWYSLEETEDFRHGYRTVRSSAVYLGEIQLKVSVELPGVAPERVLKFFQDDRLNAYKRKYKTKVWFYKCRITVCSVKFSTDGKASSISRETRVRIYGARGERYDTPVVHSAFPTWNTSHTFTKSSTPDAVGLLNDDAFLVILDNGKPESKHNSEGTSVIGQRLIGIDYLVNEMGYIDKDGLEYTECFDMHTEGSATKAELKLTFKLTPVNETRIMVKPRMAVHVGYCEGLNIESCPAQPKFVFPRLQFGSNSVSGTCSPVIHGYANIYSSLRMDFLTDIELNEEAELSIVEVVSCKALVSTRISVRALMEHDCMDVSFEYREQDSNDDVSANTNKGFAQLKSENGPSIVYSARAFRNVHFLEPILGYVNISLMKVKLEANTFSNMCCVIRHNDRQVVGKIYMGVVGMVFEEDEFSGLFPVKSYREPVVIEVWRVELDSTIKPKKLASTEITIYDLIEYESLAIFSNPRILLPVPLDSVHVELRDNNKRRGTLTAFMRFRENVVNGSLAIHASPKTREKKKFSLHAIRREINRTVSLAKDLSYMSGILGYVLNWKNPPVTALALGLLVLFCTLDFWTARVLALFPIFGIIYIMNRHKDRVDGVFVSNLLQKSNTAGVDLKARIVISVLKARDLTRSGNSDIVNPFFRLSFVNSWRSDGKFAPKKVLIGQSRTLQDTQSPNWSTTAVGYKTHSKTSTLIKWKGAGDFYFPAFESFISRVPHKTVAFEVDVIGTRGMQATAFDEFKCQIRIASQSSVDDMSQQLSVPDVFGFRQRRNTDAETPKITEEDKQVLHSESTNMQEFMERFSTKGDVRKRNSDKELHWLDPPFISTSPKVCNCPAITSTIKVLLADAKSSALAKETRTVKAYLNPKWNERVIFFENAVTSARYVVLVIQGRDSQKKKSTLETIGHAFISVDHFKDECGGSFYGWVQLHHFDANMKEWVRVGEILLRINVAGDYSVQRQKQALITEDEEAMEEDTFTQASYDTDEIPKEYSWNDSCTSAIVEVFDEHVDGDREFLGSVAIPLPSIVANANKSQQPVFEQWLPLSMAFDGSKADKALFARSIHESSVSTVSKNEGASKTMPAKASSLTSSYESFPWESVNRSAPFGEILVRAQITLPDPGAEEAYQELQLAKQADGAKDSKLLVWRMIQKTGQGVQNTIQGINDTLESIKNLFNWTHPQKTKVMLVLMVLLTLLFIWIPSRFIVLFVGIFLFTERFRPYGTMGIRLKHMMSLLPTQEDLQNVYSTGSILGNADIAASSEDDIKLSTEASSTSKGSAISGLAARFQKYAPMIRESGKFKRGGFRKQLIVSEQDCKLTGHLRIISTGKQMRKMTRLYFAIAQNNLLYWTSKDSLQVSGALGSLRHICHVYAVTSYHRNDMEFLQKVGISDTGICELAIVVVHNIKPANKDDLLASDDSESDEEIQHTPKSSYSNSKTGTTSYLIASCIEKRNKWIKMLETYCVMSPQT